MTDATVTLAGSPVSREEVAQFEKLAAHAGYQFGCGKVNASHGAPAIDNIIALQSPGVRPLMTEALCCTSPGVTEAILESLAAGVPPKGLATVLDVLSRRQAQALSTAAAGIRERGRPG
jgi:hypothetical protein